MSGWIRARSFPLGLLLVAGCTPLVTADFPDIVVTLPGIEVPPPPSSAPSSVAFTFSFNSAKLGANTNLQAQSQIVAVKLHRLVLTAVSGVSDLSFIQTLHALAFVPIKNSSTTMRQVEIADYVRSGDASVGATFVVPLPEPVDLLPLMRPSKSEQNKIDVVVNLGGQIPSVIWQVDVSMSISVELRE